MTTQPAMKKKEKITVVSLSLLIVAIPILFIYLTFTNSTDCSQLVIDTYELHSGINIPKVEFVNCYFDADLNTRISVYNLKGVVDKANFKLVSFSSVNQLQGLNLLSTEERPQQADIWLASGKRWGTQWTYAFDDKTNRLWAELNY